MSISTKRNFFLFVPVLLLLISSCNPASFITGMDISSIYTGQKANSLQLTELYHINDSISAVGLVMPAGLIHPDPKTKKYSKKGNLKYEVIGAGKRIVLVDSATFSISDTSDNESVLAHSWNFRAPTGFDYYIKATYSVPDNREDFLLLEYFDKKNHSCQSWYRFQSETGEYLSKNTTAFDTPLRLVSNDTSNRQFIVKYYSRDFAFPIPPFVDQYRPLFNYEPDSMFQLEFRKGKSDYFKPTSTGFYFFQADTAKLQGPTLFRVYAGFPKVTMHALMLESLRYITSSKEFQQLKSFPVPKLAVDSFWIASAGRPDLATELIRKYYKRVETANELYTSYTEGWKTDRGMIYIVMGKPNKVFRSFEEEIWVYGDYEDTHSLKFYFTKASNPFTNNDYVLTRIPYYKSIWFQNVQVWRQ